VTWGRCSGERWLGSLREGLLRGKIRHNVRRYKDQMGGGVWPLQQG